MKAVRRAALVSVAFASALAITSCSKRPPPETPGLRTTRAFDAVFGEVPSLPLPGPAYASVAYFPSSLEPGKFRPVPIFSAEPGKEEMLTVRAVIRGIEVDEGPVDEFLEEISYPFAPGAELAALAYVSGVAKVTVGGTFRAETLSDARQRTAAKALALTVAQFGKAAKVEVTDGRNAARFEAGAGGAEIVDIGPPRILGLLAVRETEGEAPRVLSVLFDRPVFVEEVGFRAPGADAEIPGKVYSTGFGMTVEMHPDPPALLEGDRPFRVRFAVRDGKGRRAVGAAGWIPRVVTRH